MPCAIRSPIILQGDTKWAYRDPAAVYLGQEQWPWAKERLTAATALELMKEPGIGRYVVFFHGESQRGIAANFCLTPV